MWLWIIAAVTSAFIKGLCGVGDAPVFSSILAFRHDNIDISPVSLLMSLPTNIYLAWKYRKSLIHSIWVPLSVMIVIGSLCGTLMLKNTDTHVLKIWFGVFITLVGVLLLLNELSTKKRKASKIMLVVIGILAGITSGLFGIAVLLVVYFTQTTENLNEFKGNICMVFAVENSFRLILYILTGIITAANLKQAAMTYPFILIGLFLGLRSSAFLDERKAKIVIMITLIFSGIFIVASNL